MRTWRARPSSAKYDTHFGSFAARSALRSVVAALFVFERRQLDADLRGGVADPRQLGELRFAVEQLPGALGADALGEQLALISTSSAAAYSVRAQSGPPPGETRVSTRQKLRTVL